ncbi:MAG: LlaJI family restriction endonuclease [Clostridium sp.]|uniref:LlaJI family restriction endonuclease n=1 Tax=Clostridium sp. TaxID=1506 RepID=UPI003F3176D0
MILVYCRELEKYSFKELLKKFNIIDEKKGIELIKKLKSYGIMKVTQVNSKEINLDELNDDEIEIFDENINGKEKRYSFKYVGIVTLPEHIIICYPKYIKSNEEPKREMKQILKVIKKYDSSQQQTMNLYNEGLDEKNFNYLAMIIYLINDYYENGLYAKEEQIIELNGEGEILWEKTINETYAYIVNERPHYLDLYTMNSTNNDEDYFTKLHRAILTKCSEKLIEIEISELLDIGEVELSDLELEEFGDVEHILYRLEREMNEQYMTKKQNMLKAMYAYIANSRKNFDGLEICFYGTRHFNLVWEKVCAEALNNKIDSNLGILPLNGFENKTEMKLKEIIEKPKWMMYEDKKDRIAKKTLIPDLISIYKKNEGYGIAILDAKYYDIKVKNNSIKDQPGIEDVSKQYLYQLAYQEFIKKSGYEFIANAFLVPTEGETQNIGQARIDMLYNIPEKGLKNIEIIKLNAQDMYEAYINGKIIKDEKILKILEDNIEERDYKRELKNSIGARIILDTIKRLSIENVLEIKGIEDEVLETQEQLQEDDEIYETFDMLKIAVEVDILFRENKEITLEQIEMLIESLELNDKNSIPEGLFKKLECDFKECHSRMYWLD